MKYKIKLITEYETENPQLIIEDLLKMNLNTDEIQEITFEPFALRGKELLQYQTALLETDRHGHKVVTNLLLEPVKEKKSFIDWKEIFARKPTWRSKSVTDKQKAFLLKHDFTEEDLKEYNRGDAADMISFIIASAIHDSAFSDHDWGIDIDW